MSSYVEPEELARVLKIRTPSVEQQAALERMVVAASLEIDHEIARADDDPLSDDELALVEQVALQRGAELWHLQEVPLGLAGIGSELGTSHLARNSWEKYSFTLAPLRRQWGLA